MQEAVVLGRVVSAIWVTVGIIVSLILPVAVEMLQKAKPDRAMLESNKEDHPSFWQRIVSFGRRVYSAWKNHGGNRYLVIVVAAVVVAVVLVVLMDLKFFTVRDALLAGFAWESLINKLRGGAKVANNGNQPRDPVHAK